MERALVSDDLAQQAEVLLNVAEDHLEHLNVMIARQFFLQALSVSSQVDNTIWVRRAHSGLGQTLLATGLSLFLELSLVTWINSDIPQVTSPRLLITTRLS